LDDNFRGKTWTSSRHFSLLRLAIFAFTLLSPLSWLATWSGRRDVSTYMCTLNGVPRSFAQFSLRSTEALFNRVSGKVFCCQPLFYREPPFYPTSLSESRPDSELPRVQRLFFNGTARLCLVRWIILPSGGETRR
jgi:hypothetical protein